MKFCKECGNKLKEGAQFCNKCGTPVGEKKQETSPTHNTYQAPPQAPPQISNTLRMPMTKKSKKTLIATGIALVVLFGGYKVGEILTSKDRLVDRFQTALEKKDAKAVASLLSSDDKSVKINEKSVQGLIKFFDKHPDEVANMVQDLKTESKLYDKTGLDNVPKVALDNSLPNQNFISLEKEGKILFYDQYKLNIKPVYVTLSTNYKDTDLYVDGEKVGKSDGTDFNKTYGPFLPGIHTAQADLKTSFTDLKTNKDVEQTDSKRVQPIDLSLYAQNITLDLGENVQNLNLTGRLFINGKDVGVDPFKNSTFGPVLTDGSMTAAVEATMPWGSVKTDEVPIKDSNMFIGLISDSQRKDIMNQVVKFMNEEMYAFAMDDVSKMTTATINEKAVIKNNSDQRVSNRLYFIGSIKSVMFDLNKINPIYNVYTGTWQINGSAQLVGHTALYSDRETPNTQDNTTDYQFTLNYDQKSKNWMVDNYTESYGFNSFKTQTITVDKPVEYSSQGSQAVAVTANANVPSNVKTAMDGYENGLISAINDNNFIEVQNFLIPNSTLYKTQQDLITKLTNAGIKEQLLGYQITGYHDNNDGTCTITTHEKAQINYSNGTSETKEYDWVYTGNFNGDNSVGLKSIGEKK